MRSLPKLWPAVLALALAASGAAATPAAPVAVPDAPLLEARTADLEVLDGVVAESSIDTAAGRPTVSLYFRDAGAVLSGWLAELLARYLPGLGKVTRGLARAAPFVLAALVGVLAARLLVGLLRRRRGREPSPAPVAVLPPEEGPPRRTAGEWEAEVRRRLESRDAAAAGEALWWWLATVLGAAAEPSWTSRELLSRARRPDLAAPVHRLDRLLYGPHPAALDEVRGLYGELREVAA